ncbi:MAG TPA: efflux RND transporter periplasmic adaptor subunit [Bacteroidales bacterium]|nr:efflux RND transporter periplasmic adaptor subunit [Bacteroidales bacterium]HPJ59778.1 efflux RND transporter periplasmic adaptor subunit [Bacteroidales bacterium]HPR12551.1 efflux RND transporter periplasmic adaptor subunit [Bacteroidales bacterium]
MKKVSLFKIILTKYTCVILLTVDCLALASCNGKQESAYTVMKGPFRQSVIETGELEAVNAYTVSMPRINYVYGSRFKIIGLTGYGEKVRKGEPVVILDPASVEKYIIEKSESLENELASASKLKAQLTNNLQDLRAQMRNEQAAYDIKKLQYNSSAFESEGVRKIIELEFRASEIRLNKIKRKLELRPRLDSLDYRIQQIKVVQKEDELKAARETLERLKILSPLDGIFVLERNRSTGQQVKLGDEMYIGYPIARIPDIRTMKVNSMVLENDISKIKPGLGVIVRLDALPSVPFHGKISRVNKVCIEMDKKKVFLAEVLLSESDIRLKPGMTVSCEYITYEGADEVFVPNNCIVEENKHYYLFVRRRGKIRKTEVSPGPSNNMYTVVTGDLSPGQSLVLPENILTN